MEFAENNRGGQNMQFIITAHDGENMYEKRMTIRQRHLDNIAKLMEQRHILCAGGILDADGKLAGSALVMDFEDREQLDEYLRSEPYMTEKVWAAVVIEQMNVVIVNNEKVGK